MDIVMLGQSAAGKTTYVSLMYAVMTEGIGGFSARAKDSLDHARLMRTAEAVLTGQYPNPSDQRTVFPLVLRHDNTDVVPFSWRDYRGGVLSERTDSPQAVEMHEDLRRADGIMLLCDSYRLVNDPAVGRQVRTLVSHVQRAIGARGETITPLVIAATKADLVDLDDDKVIERLAAPFEPLIDAVASSRYVVGTFLPVACGPQPFNVHLPALWMLRYGIISRARRLQQHIEGLIADMERHRRGDTLGNRFKSWWDGTTPEWQKAERARLEALEKMRVYEPLIDPANRLGELLEEVSGF